MSIKTMGIWTAKMLALTLMIFTIAGCTPKPKIAEAETYVDSKVQIAKLELYKNQLATLKDSLISIPPEVYSKDWKAQESNIGKLDYYLSHNDCAVQQDTIGCYRETRLILITTTKELDAANEKNNLLNQVVDRLSGNVSAIIDNLDDQKANEISVKDKVMDAVTGNTKALLDKK